MLTERSVEIPWVLDRARGARDLLDVGAAGSKYLPALSQVAHQVTAIDTREFEVPYGVTGFICDAAGLPAEWTGRFDCVTCVSVLDHVGLDAYGQVADAERLGRVVAELTRVTAIGGRLLVTVPVGQPALTTHPNGGQRVFGIEEMGWMWGDGWGEPRRQFWRRDGDDYKKAWPDEIDEAKYGGMFALACGAYEWVRR